MIVIAQAVVVVGHKVSVGDGGHAPNAFEVSRSYQARPRGRARELSSDRLLSRLICLKDDRLARELDRYR